MHKLRMVYELCELFRNNGLPHNVTKSVNYVTKIILVPIYIAVEVSSR